MQAIKESNQFTIEDSFNVLRKEFEGNDKMVDYKGYLVRFDTYKCHDNVMVVMDYGFKLVAQYTFDKDDL